MHTGLICGMWQRDVVWSMHGQRLRFFLVLLAVWLYPSYLVGQPVCIVMYMYVWMDIWMDVTLLFYFLLYALCFMLYALCFMLSVFVEHNPPVLVAGGSSSSAFARRTVTRRSSTWSSHCPTRLSGVQPSVRSAFREGGGKTKTFILPCARRGA